jgi:DEAD/DEAH box helicase domain-containing protein
MAWIYLLIAGLLEMGWAIGHDRGRVAGLYRYNPAPSEPDLRLATHPAQASHKLQIVPECIC